MLTSFLPLERLTPAPQDIEGFHDLNRPAGAHQYLRAALVLLDWFHGTPGLREVRLAPKVRLASRVKDAGADTLPLKVVHSLDFSVLGEVPAVLAERGPDEAGQLLLTRYFPYAHMGQGEFVVHEDLSPVRAVREFPGANFEGASRGVNAQVLAVAFELAQLLHAGLGSLTVAHLREPLKTGGGASILAPDQEVTVDMSLRMLEETQHSLPFVFACQQEDELHQPKALWAAAAEYFVSGALREFADHRKLTAIALHTRLEHSLHVDPKGDVQVTLTHGARLQCFSGAEPLNVPAVARLVEDRFPWNITSEVELSLQRADPMVQDVLAGRRARGGCVAGIAHELSVSLGPSVDLSSDTEPLSEAGPR